MLDKHKHKRRKQSKTAYVRLECIDGSKVAVKPGMNDKQTQKQADCNGAALSLLYKTEFFTAKTSLLITSYILKQ